MKKILITLFLWPLAILAADSPWDTKLPFKSATLEYQVTGSMNGTKTLYIKDYGQKSAEYTDTVMSMFGMKQQQKNLTLTTPDWVYEYDLVAREGTKQINPTKIFNEEYNKLSRSEQKKLHQNAEKFGIDFIGGLQGKIKKNAATILGQKCDLSEVMGTQVYTLSGTSLPLKISSKTLGLQTQEEAIKFNKDSVPDSKFQHPKGITAHHNPDTDHMIREQIRSTMQTLIDGKAPSAYPTGSTQNQQESQNNNQLNDEQQQQLNKIMKMFGG